MTGWLSLPTSTALTGPTTRWVVQDLDCGYYDGLSGASARSTSPTPAPDIRIYRQRSPSAR
ncbi:hypothetical protein GCM10010339_52920 [Streptomyces alanosinicus]|uniref:Uncharacterized protein n=1 Tax=Streptomyces alanosinicus TaxID=68171 RepID=A0A919D4G0_9ACTN|nr:hypothetical protein GCM10010339_52920 [Streptomyces alanosinicus]